MIINTIKDLKNAIKNLPEEISRIKEFLEYVENETKERR